jgi:inhibitor of cysteine peptidase
MGRRRATGGPSRAGTVAQSGITLALFIGAVAGCSGGGEPASRSTSDSQRTFTEADTGTTHDVAVGQQICIRLAANHSTGYSWALVTPTAGTLVQRGDPTYSPDSAAAGVGAGGVETWCFEAARAGREELRFEYRRPWEAASGQTVVPAARAASFAFQVR